jgi:hypothetical protein
MGVRYLRRDDCSEHGLVAYDCGKGTGREDEHEALVDQIAAEQRVLDCGGAEELACGELGHVRDTVDQLDAAISETHDVTRGQPFLPVD